MNKIKYFDCHASIGRYEGKDPAAPWTTEDLLTEMDRCQIHGALVYSHIAATVNPEVGNPTVIEICKEHPRLFPCWITLPHHSGEYFHPKDLLPKMEENNIKALKLFPRMSKFRVDKFTLGPLLDLMQEAGHLLIFDRGEYENAVQVEWEELEWLCDNYPKLPVLLHGVRWESTRTLLPIADRFENLHFEFSNYQGNRMLEFWCKRIGHERLLFGTHSPHKSIGAARAYVDYSDLTNEQRIAIAGGNLQRLLKVKESVPEYPQKEIRDKILLNAFSAKPIEDMTVIDAHAHITCKGGKGAAMVVMNQSGAKGVVERNRRIGVNKTCVSAWTAIWGDYKLGNKDTIQAIKDFPDEIIGYVALDPNYVTDWEKECKYYHEELKLPGMKPYHPKMGIPYNHPWFDPWWEYGNEHYLFALMHPSDNFQAEMEDLANRYQNISFLLAHSGWTWKTVRTHVELAKNFPNCFLELTFTSVLNGSIEFMVKEVGSERVLYGSDAPMRDPFPQFGWVAYANITEEDKRNILGRNMEKIIAKVKL
jgi:predicted TIM-barrel fold metal-dependent hydrolase